MYLIGGDIIKCDSTQLLYIKPLSLGCHQTTFQLLGSFLKSINMLDRYIDRWIDK